MLPFFENYELHRFILPLIAHWIKSSLNTPVYVVNILSSPISVVLF